MTSNGDYPVGYGKPPAHSRFKPGRSGNPKGRPRRARNLKTDLRDELRAVVTIREGGRERRVTKQRAMIAALIARAMQGDPRAVGRLVELIERLFDMHEERHRAAPLSAEEQAILQALAERFPPGDKPKIDAGDDAAG